MHHRNFHFYFFEFFVIIKNDFRNLRLKSETPPDIKQRERNQLSDIGQKIENYRIFVLNIRAMNPCSKFLYPQSFMR
jgi:hypothetical protein